MLLNFSVRFKYYFPVQTNCLLLQLLKVLLLLDKMLPHFLPTLFAYVSYLWTFPNQTEHTHVALFIVDGSDIFTGEFGRLIIEQ